MVLKNLSSLAQAVFQFFSIPWRNFCFLFSSPANRRAGHLPSGENTLQPCFGLWWVPLSSGNWKHSCHYICQRRTWWRFAVSDGLLLHPAFHLLWGGVSSLCHSDRSLTGQYPRARHHRLVQKSHGRVKCFH